jgi:hypothetical protein
VVLVDIPDHNFQHPEFHQVKKDANSKPGHDANIIQPVLEIVAYRILRLHPMDCKGDHGQQTPDEVIQGCSDRVLAELLGDLVADAEIPDYIVRYAPKVAADVWEIQPKQQVNLHGTAFEVIDQIDCDQRGVDVDQDHQLGEYEYQVPRFLISGMERLGLHPEL